MKGKKLLPALLMVAVVACAAADGILLYLIRDSGIHSFGFPGGQALAGVAFALIGYLIVTKAGSNPIGWLLLLTGVSSGLTAFTEDYGILALVVAPGSLPAGGLINWIGTWVWAPGFLLIAASTMIFPQGRLRSPGWRWPFRGLVLCTLLAIASLALYTLDPAAYPPGGILQTNFSNQFFVGFAIGIVSTMVITLVSVGSLLFRVRRVSGLESRQIKVFAIGAALLAFGLLYGSLVNLFRSQTVFDQSIAVVGLLSFPTSIGVAVLKYRLYEMELFLNKAIVYGALAVFIAIVYMAITIGTGALVRGGSVDPLPVAATALVALAFQPLRQRFQRFANVLVYGKRVTPYEAMADFSQRISAALSLEDVLPEMAEAAANGVSGVASSVELFMPGGEARLARWPIDHRETSFDRTVSILHLGEEVGEISVKKRPGESVSTIEEKLLLDLASQAGPALSNVRFAEDLKTSRRRIVAAQDEERRRMERDIHDGAQQQLVSMSVKLGLAKALMSKDPEKASGMMDELKSEASEAVETLRDLARGLFPPILSEKGLVSALRAHIDKMAIPAHLEADSLPRLSPEVEAALYFVIREALQNATKYAPGAQIAVLFAQSDGEVTFEVKNDGPGFDPANAKMGSGLQNMKDRVEALGGRLDIESHPSTGTLIRGRVPAAKLERVG